MKKAVSTFLAIIMLFLFLPAVRAADIFDAPQLALQSETQTDRDIVYLFSKDCGAAAGYERQRSEIYNRLLAQYGSPELAEAALTAAGQEALIYPVKLMAEIKTDNVVLYMGMYDVSGDALRLTLCEDILPALNANGRFTGRSFDFELRFKLVLHNAVNPTTASPEIRTGTFHAPAAAHISYEIAEDAVNPNPSFVLLPYDEDLLLKNPTRPGFLFAGWVDLHTGGFINRIPANTKSASLAARWNPRSYTVNYVLTTRPGPFIYADNSKNPQSYLYGSETEIFALKEQSGYLFMGWYESPDFSGQAVTMIGPQRTGDLILYAKWRTRAEAEAELIKEKGWCDLDADGSVSASDARLALRASVGLEELNPAQIRRVDFTGNGIVTASTARQILRIAVGLDDIAEVLRYYSLL